MIIFRKIRHLTLYHKQAGSNPSAVTLPRGVERVELVTHGRGWVWHGGDKIDSCLCVPDLRLGMKLIENAVAVCRAAVLALASGVLANQCPAADDYNSPWERIFAGEAYAVQRVLAMSDVVFDELLPGGTSNYFPLETQPEGDWLYRNSSSWGAGFFAGMVWLAAEVSGENLLWQRARDLTARLSGWPTRALDHDIGFNVLSSFGLGYDFSGDVADREAVVTGANTLSSEHWMPAVGSLWSFNFNNSRESPSGTGRWIGPIRSRQNVIIDTSMNIELLFAGARLGGSADLAERGRSHLCNVVRDMVRPDGSTIQVVDYWLSDQLVDGELVAAAGDLRGAYAWQGYSGTSTWSRGQGWAIHGLASGYRETGDPQLLEGLLRVANYYLRETPADGIPYWDYDVHRIDNQLYLDYFALRNRDLFVRDSSAAAVAAAGLLELYRLLDDEALAWPYFAMAEKILVSLSTPEPQGGYLSEGTAYASILTQGTYTFDGYNKGLIWGDFYYLQALRRYRELTTQPLRWAADPVAGRGAGWGHYPQKAWAYRWHAGRSAMGVVHGQVQTGLDGHGSAVALLDAPLAADFAFAIDCSLASRSGLHPDANIRIIHGWHGPQEYDFVQLSASPGGSGLYRSRNGSASRWLDLDDALLSDYGWHRVGLQRSGSLLRVELDGRTVALVADAPSSSGGQVGLASVATAAFFANPAISGAAAASDYAVWAQSTIADPALRDPLADASRNGRANLLDYLLGPPAASGADALQLAVRRDGSTPALEVSYLAYERNDHAVRISWSTDLQSWHDTRGNPPPGTSLLLVRDSLPLPDGRFRYTLSVSPVIPMFFRLEAN